MNNRKIAMMIPLRVQPKQGDRSAARVSKAGKPFVVHFKDRKVVDNEAELAAYLAPYVPDKPLSGPVRQRIKFVYPWLKKHGKDIRGLPGRIPKSTNPDLENLEKQVNDVLESMGFLANDAQIADKQVCKVFGASYQTIITLEEIHA